MNDREPVIDCRGVDKAFREGGLAVDVLSGLAFRVEPGEQVAILGRSGSGKSTLLHLLGGLEDPDAGEIRIQGERLAGLGPAARGRLRNRALGFVYQFHHLLGEFTALENVAMPLLIRGSAIRPALGQATQMLEQVGLDRRLDHKPGELSGGERQRVAIARALINDPAVLLADEPTGNLDAATGGRIIDILAGLHRKGQTIVMVTHDASIARQADRQLTLEQGRLI